MTISTCNTIYYGEQLGFIKENGNLFIPKIYFPYRYPVLTFLVSATPASIVDSSWVRFLCTRNDSYKPSGIEWDCWNVYYKRPVKQDSGNWAPVCRPKVAGIGSHGGHICIFRDPTNRPYNTPELDLYRPDATSIGQLSVRFWHITVYLRVLDTIISDLTLQLYKILQSQVTGQNRTDTRGIVAVLARWSPILTHHGVSIYFYLFMVR